MKQGEMSFHRHFTRSLVEEQFKVFPFFESEPGQRNEWVGMGMEMRREQQQPTAEFMKPKAFCLEQMQRIRKALIR
jgi:hypothetical protein